MTTRRNLATNPGFELDSDHDGLADGVAGDKSTAGSWPYSLGARLGANGQYSQRISYGGVAGDSANLCTNPSFETGTAAGVLPTGVTDDKNVTGASPWEVGSALGAVGSKSFRILYTGVAGDTNKYIAPYLLTEPGSVAAGDTVTVSLLVKGSWSGLTSLVLRAQYQDSGGVGLGLNVLISSQATSPISTATRMSVTMPAAPATTSRLRFTVLLLGIDNGDTIDLYLDDLLIKPSTYIAPYLLTEPGSFAAGDVATVSLLVKGSWSGLTNALIHVQFNDAGGVGVGAAVDTALPPTMSTATRFSCSVPAVGATISKLRVTLQLPGIDEGDTIDLYLDDLSIMKSSSFDPDGEWTRQGVILSASDDWEYIGGHGYLLQAKILPLGTGWQCWYLGNGDDVLGIGYATAPSPLGPWTKYVGNPLPFRCIDPDVVLVDGIYHMFGCTGPYTAIVHCTSADGVTWSAVDTVLEPAGDWESGPGGMRIFDPCVLQGTDGVWYMYHAGIGTLGERWGVATSASISGPWTEWGENPFPYLLNAPYQMSIWKPFVRIIDETYYMWFHSGEEGTAFGCDDIYRAHSGGPLGPWTLDDPHPMFARGTYDEGVGVDASQVSDVCVVRDENQYYLIYTAARHADSTLAPAVIKVATLPPVDIAAIRTALTLDGLNLNDGSIYAYLPGVELGARLKTWNERKSYTGVVAQYNVSEAASIPMKFPLSVQGTSPADIAAKVEIINAKIEGCSSASPKNLVFAGATYQIVTTPRVAYVLDEVGVVVFRALIDLVLNRLP